jgi:hypothetical protein
MRWDAIKYFIYDAVQFGIHTYHDKKKNLTSSAAAANMETGLHSIPQFRLIKQKNFLRGLTCKHDLVILY